MTLDGTYLYDIARHLGTATGIKGAYCGEGDGDTVKPIPESLENGTPALVVWEGEHTIIAASHERHTVTVEARIYIARAVGLGKAAEMARSYKWLLLTLIRAGGESDEIKNGSLVGMRFRALEDAEWPIQSGRWYFVLPFELELKLNESVLYQPWQPLTP